MANNIRNKNGNDFDDYFKVWKYYEDVAMHFNDLIIRLRAQSIGGIAALATVLGIVIKSCDQTNGGFNYGLAIIAILCLMLFWVAIWVLDQRYYNRLLEGSVNAILELEKNKEQFLENKEISLSRNIEKAFKVKFEHENRNGKIEIKENESRKNFISGRNWFYGIVFGALCIVLLSTSFMCYKNCKQKKDVPKASSAVQAISENKNINKVLEKVPTPTTAGQ
jgi:Na+/melibiose symporter-like transporter